MEHLSLTSSLGPDEAEGFLVAPWGAPVTNSLAGISFHALWFTGSMRIGPTLCLVPRFWQGSLFIVHRW
jgi:hypothetical protein